MKRIYVLPVFLLFVYMPVGRCNSTPTDLTPREVQNLALLGKIWGFIKYYHPVVAKGQANWDSALSTKIQSFMNATDNKGLDNLVSKWLDELGPLPACPNCDNELANKITSNFDTAWITQSGLSPESVTRLRFIRTNRYQGKHYYYAYGPSRQIKIINEERYNTPEFQYPPPSFRLLTLFRYWNIVNYFSPYKYLSTKGWDQVLIDCIPQFFCAKDTLSYQLGILNLIGSLDDGHASFTWSSVLSRFFGEYSFVPFQCTIIEQKAVVTRIFNDSLCRYYGIKVNDIIDTIENVSVAERIEKFMPYTYGASNEDGRLSAISSVYLFSGSNSLCRISIRNSNGMRHLTIKRSDRFIAASTSEPVASWRWVTPNIGYVNMEYLQPKEVAAMMDTLGHSKGLVFDLRGYPNDTWHELVKRLASRPFYMNKFSYPDLNYPGVFKFFPDRLVGDTNSRAYSGIVTILVNADTKSHGEYSAMGLQQATHTITIGSCTAGTDGDVTGWIDLPGGFRTRFSGLGVFYPNGVTAQRTGVKIDIVRRPTIQGLLAGKDELLEAAIAYIQEHR